MREDTRAAWQFQWLEDLWKDLRYAARSFAKDPGFVAVAVLSLAIGIGANCVMFSIVDALLFRPPRVPRPNEIVTLTATAKASQGSAASYPDFADIRSRSRSFQSLAAFSELSTGLAARPGVEPRVRYGKLVTGGFFDVLGAKPEMGRAFLPEETEAPGNELVAILSHECWEQDFGADPNVLGKRARVNGVDFRIVGVMPARISDGDEDLSENRAFFYLPLRVAPRVSNGGNTLENRGQRWLTVRGRLEPGVPLAQAKAEVAAIAGGLERQYPETDRDRSILVRTPFEDSSTGGGGVCLGQSS